METFIGIIIMIDAYAIVYYRLVVKYYYESENDVKESNFGAIFSFPPHSKLSDKGKRYSKYYWIAVAILFFCVALLVPGRDFTALQSTFKSIP